MTPLAQLLARLPRVGEATAERLARSMAGGLEVWALGRGIGFGREIEHATDQEIVEALAHRVAVPC